MRDLKDKVIIITGASSGIGAATAIACAKAGMHVVLNARREDRLQALAKEITKLGRRAELVAGDVADTGLSERLLHAAASAFGHFDMVFANAGYGFDRSLIDISELELREMFEVNFFAGFDLLQRAARRLIETSRPGHLLMCSSCLAKFTLPYSGPYCATKASQNHVCRAMNIELRPRNIRVSSVHPIGTRTEFFESSAKRSGRPEYATKVIDETPRFMMQPPERVANAIVRCLRRPRPEVWTSFSVRLMAAVFLAFPRLGDLFMSQAGRRLSAEK